jgi:hypothetical protein
MFETIHDKILFKFVKIIMENVDFESLDSSQDDELYDELNRVSTYFGFRINDTSLELDYIYNLYQLNEEVFDEDKLHTSLNRPSIKTVKFEWNVSETQWVNSIYGHEIETYCSDKVEIFDYIEGLRNKGDINWYEGVELSSEVDSTETTDDSINKNSFKIT